MANRKRRVVLSGLEGKGFVREDRNHVILKFWHDGKPTPIHTLVSHGRGSEDLDSTLLSLMAKQCKIPNASFLDLVDCPLSEEGL